MAMMMTATLIFPATANDDPTNNVYVVTVRATEVVPDDQEEPAKYTEIQVRVTVDERGRGRRGEHPGTSASGWVWF